MLDRFNQVIEAVGMRAELKAEQIFAPVEAYKNILFKRLVYTVWSITGFYSIFFGILGARLPFWVIFSGVILLSPFILILEYFDQKYAARMLFILSCNAYIYFSSLGLGHQVSAEYFYLPSLMIPLLLYNTSWKRPLILSIGLTIFFWLLTVTLGLTFIPDTWVATNLPFELIKNINFFGAMIVTLIFLLIFIKTNNQLKEILTATVRAEAEADKILSHQLLEAQRTAKIGSWSYDFLTGQQIWSTEHYKIFEIEEPQTQDSLHKLYRERIHPDDIFRLDQFIECATKFGEDFIYNHRVCLDGGKRIKFVQGIGKVNKDSKGVPISISGTCQDQTDLVSIQEENKFIIDSLGIGIWKWDVLTNVLEWDSNMYRLYGADPRDFSGAYDAWENSLSLETKERAIQEINAAVQGVKDFDTNFEVVLKTGGVQNIRSKAFVIRDSSGTAQKMWGINVDRNREALAEYERQSVQRELEIERSKSIRNAKLASLGEMAAGIAHEINNPLAIISGSVGLLSKYSDDPKKIASKIETIKKSCDRITRIVFGLKKFSRSGDVANFKNYELSNIIDDVAFLVEAKAKRNSTPIIIDCQSRSQVFCDEVEIEQVLVNLINNAIDAVKKSPEKWVKVLLFNKDDKVVLRVIDSGQGIPEDVRNKLFEPFFTTKMVGEGTGLGLSITKGILDEHKATISVVVDSPNTCFEIKFPEWRS